MAERIQSLSPKEAATDGMGGLCDRKHGEVSV